MMKIYYRILSINKQDGSIVVRFFSDTLSERDLRKNPEDKNNPPLACRTDYSFDIHDFTMDEAKLHAFILARAPAGWLARKARIATLNDIAAFTTIDNLIGQVKSDEVAVSEEQDVTHLLG